MGRMGSGRRGRVEEKKSKERRGWGKKRRKGKCGKNGIWEEGKRRRGERKESKDRRVWGKRKKKVTTIFSTHFNHLML